MKKKIVCKQQTNECKLNHMRPFQSKYIEGVSQLLHSKGIRRSKLLIKGSLATYLVAAPYLHTITTTRKSPLSLYTTRTPPPKKNNLHQPGFRDNAILIFLSQIEHSFFSSKWMIEKTSNQGKKKSHLLSCKKYEQSSTMYLKHNLENNPPLNQVK